MVCPGRGVSYVCLRNRCLDTGVLHVVTHASESVSSPVVGMRFGYTRVSTVAQTLHQQHDALKAAGVSKIFSDNMSGARDDRPGLAALMGQLRAFVISNPGRRDEYLGDRAWPLEGAASG